MRAAPQHPSIAIRNRDLPRTGSWRAITAGALLFALLTGCEEPPPPQPPSVSTEFQRGPFKLVVRAFPAEVSVGDQVTIALHVETPSQHVVRFPTTAELADQEIPDITATELAGPSIRADGGLNWTQTITIEPFLSGEITIPALVVWYSAEPAAADQQPAFDHELISEPLNVIVRSALTSQDSVMAPRSISGTLTPPPEPLSPWSIVALAGGGLLALVLLTAFGIWLVRRANRPPPPIPPEVWALRQLAGLERSQLLEVGEFKMFYYALSEIVRVYIERQFHLAAPEMTTEEFLNLLARDRGVLPYDSQRLREFMQACDLVKYAAFVPGRSEAEHALGTARAFIDATAAAVQAHTLRNPDTVEQAWGGHAA